jgi:hypothetical protein
MSDLNEELNDRTRQLNELANGIWGLVYPGKIDWEYPTQCIVHVRALLNERDAEVARLRKALEEAVEGLRHLRADALGVGGEGSTHWFIKDALILKCNDALAEGGEK